MADFDHTSAKLMTRARIISENRGFSPQVTSLAAFTGLIGKDIDTFQRFSVSHELLIIIRQPGWEANAYAKEILEHEYYPKPAAVKMKTGSDSTVKYLGQVYVSDTDLMCIYRLNKTTGRYTTIELKWDSKRAKTIEEEKYIGALNGLLISNIQHGCNDDYLESGKPRNVEIGYDFLAFDCGKIQCIDFKDLRAYYNEKGLKWHEEYRAGKA